MLDSDPTIEAAHFELADVEILTSVADIDVIKAVCQKAFAIVITDISAYGYGRRGCKTDKRLHQHSCRGAN